MGTPEDRWFEAPDGAATAFLWRHAAELASRQSSLLRLPSLVHAAVVGAGLEDLTTFDDVRVVPLYVLGAAVVPVAAA